jgi:hypothetical protein
MDESEDVSCLLADPITGEGAFRELPSWSMTGQIPPKVSALLCVSSPLIANPIVIDRALHVVASVHSALAADILPVRVVGAPASSRRGPAGGGTSARHWNRTGHSSPARPANFLEHVAVVTAPVMAAHHALVAVELFWVPGAPCRWPPAAAI